MEKSMKKNIAPRLIWLIFNVVVLLLIAKKVYEVHNPPLELNSNTALGTFFAAVAMMIIMKNIIDIIKILLKKWVPPQPYPQKSSFFPRGIWWLFYFFQTFPKNNFIRHPEGGAQPDEGSALCYRKLHNHSSASGNTRQILHFASLRSEWRFFIFLY